MIELVPPNLAVLGVKRRLPMIVPDLLTIWETPYPVITRYKILCDRLGIIPFAGGELRQQGPSSEIGYITSGYRSAIIGGNMCSPHLYALALDIAIGDVHRQVVAARVAVDLFSRVGLYPDNGFIHIDLVNDAWLERYHGRLYWVRKDGSYTSFDELEPAIEFAINGKEAVI